MKSRLSAVVLLLAAAMLAALPADDAAAKPKTVEHARHFEFEARLPDADGFMLYLRAHDHRHVELTVETKNVEAPYVVLNYTTEGRVGRHGMDVDFGDFGQIHLHFEGAPKRHLYPYPNCQGHKVDVQEYGPMVGRIDFHAHGGVVAVQAHRVQEANTRAEPRRTCTPKARNVLHDRPVAEPFSARRSLKEEPSRFASLVARAHTAGRVVEVFGILREDRVENLAAITIRRFDRVTVETTIYVAESEDEPGTDAELSISGDPPRPDAAEVKVGAPPFSGSATFAKTKGSPATWLGSLATDVPGEGTLPLAGPQFRAVICAYDERDRQRACEATVAPPHEA